LGRASGLGCVERSQMPLPGRETRKGVAVLPPPCHHCPTLPHSRNSGLPPKEYGPYEVVAELAQSEARGAPTTRLQYTRPQ